LRGLVTLKLLGFNIPSAAANLSGLVFSFEKLGARRMVKSIWSLGVRGNVENFLGTGSEFKAMLELSPALSLREQSSSQAEISEQIGKVKEGGKAAKFHQKASGWAFAAFRAFDRFQVVPFWKAAFDQHLGTLSDKTKSHEEQITEAARYADALLLETHPSGTKATQSEFQRNRTGLMRNFMMFQSFFNLVGNNMTSRGRAAWEKKIPVGGDDLAKYLFAIWLASAFEQMIKDALKGRTPEWMTTLVVNPIQAYLGWIPFVKDALHTVGVSKKGDPQFMPERVLPAFISVPVQSSQKIAGAFSENNQEHKVGVASWEIAQLVSAAYGLPALNVAKWGMQLSDNVEDQEDFKGYK
jgi:hypothetical protein